MSGSERQGLLTQLKRGNVNIGPFKIRSSSIWGWSGAMPTLIIYILVRLLPVIFGIYVSFHYAPLFSRQWNFIGIDNYIFLVNNSEFIQSIWRGVVYMVGTTIIQLIFGVWVALVLNKMTRGQRFFSALAFSIYLIPTIIVTLLSLYLIDPFIGVIPAWLETLGVWNRSEYLLGNLDLAMPIVTIISSWKFSVFVTILVTAQLQGIPDRFYEVAKVCGATHYEMFRDITLPRIKGAILVAVFLRSIFMFTKFDVIWILTKGGPGDATQTLPIMAYRKAFLEGSYGQANAIAVLMFVFLLVGGIGYFKFLNPSEEVETET